MKKSSSKFSAIATEESSNFPTSLSRKNSEQKRMRFGRKIVFSEEKIEQNFTRAFCGNLPLLISNVEEALEISYTHKKT